jgi:hypothetical protein
VTRSGSPSRSYRPYGPRRAAAGLRSAAALLPAGALLLSGCGIQPTSVPVDAGEAPSRVACVLPGGSHTAPGPEDTVVRVYLVCGSRVSPVQRAVPLPEKPVAIAAVLLDALAAEPNATERGAGFASRVPGGLEVTGGTPADPPGTLRLSVPLDDLPAFALAQIVCTWAGTDAAGRDGTAEDDAVTLAGPADTATMPPRRVPCSTALRNRADAAQTAGEPVPP